MFATLKKLFTQPEPPIVDEEAILRAEIDAYCNFFLDDYIDFLMKETPHAPARVIASYSPKEVSEINIELPESTLIQSAVAAGTNSSFAKLVEAGVAFREAGLSPRYFTNKTQTAIRVIPHEYLENPNILN